eukprot:8417552-Pyramimonas_sp.AAC.1
MASPCANDPSARRPCIQAARSADLPFTAQPYARGFLLCHFWISGRLIFSYTRTSSGRSPKFLMPPLGLG